MTKDVLDHLIFFFFFNLLSTGITGVCPPLAQQFCFFMKYLVAVDLQVNRGLSYLIIVSNSRWEPVCCDVWSCKRQDVPSDILGEDRILEMTQTGLGRIEEVCTRSMKEEWCIKYV